MIENYNLSDRPILDFAKFDNHVVVKLTIIYKQTLQTAICKMIYTMTIVNLLSWNPRDRQYGFKEINQTDRQKLQAALSPTFWNPVLTITIVQLSQLDRLKHHNKLWQQEKRKVRGNVQK